MMLAMFAVENRDDWDDLLLAVMIAYCFCVYESTGFSPCSLMFGEECMVPKMSVCRGGNRTCRIRFLAHIPYGFVMHWW